MNALQQFLDFDREFADADARRVIHRGGDGAGDAGEPDFSDAARAEFVELGSPDSRGTYVELGASALVATT